MPDGSVTRRMSADPIITLVFTSIKAKKDGMPLRVFWPEEVRMDDRGFWVSRCVSKS